MARLSEHMQEAALRYYAERFGCPPLPVLTLAGHAWSRARFLSWFRASRPEAIITCYPEVKADLETFGRSVPGDVGVALDWMPDDTRFSGIQQEYASVGAAAFDLVESQLRRREFGLPAQPKIVLVRGRWVDGATVRHLH